MSFTVIQLDDEHVLGLCAKHLARSATDRGASEAWRFPYVDSYGPDSALNQVTFVYAQRGRPTPAAAPAVLGTFAGLYRRLPMRRIQFGGENSDYWALSVALEKGHVHEYMLLIDAQFVPDPINPQTVTLDNGRTWSRFFTDFCTTPVTFEDWELALLTRLVQQLTPLRTKDAEIQIRRYYFELDRAGRAGVADLRRLDDSVGEVNFIDKLLARHERHHLTDYRMALRVIDRLLRQRNPFTEPANMPVILFDDLFDEMASGNVPGWDYGAYNNPRYFFNMLRRHTVMGAFTHPRHGGNIGGAGWAYLSERYWDDAGDRTLFDWRAAIEPPLGTNPDYLG